MVLAQRDRIKAIRAALADYVYAEGCSCCCNIDAHQDAKSRLAKLLSVRPYTDGSGWEFERSRSKP